MRVQVEPVPAVRTDSSLPLQRPEALGEEQGKCSQVLTSCFCAVFLSCSDRDTVHPFSWAWPQAQLFSQMTRVVPICGNAVRARVCAHMRLWREGVESALDSLQGRARA